MNQYITDIRFSENNIWCLVNHNYMCHICAKGYYIDSNFNEAVINKVSTYHEIALNLTYRSEPSIVPCATIIPPLNFQKSYKFYININPIPKFQVAACQIEQFDRYAELSLAIELTIW